MENNIIEMVENELRIDPRTQDNDNFLIWRIMVRFGVHLSFDEFIKLPSFGTITRDARKIKEINPELKGSPNAQQAKNERYNMFKQINQPLEVSETF